MGRLRSPICYLGGKGQMVSKLLKLTPAKWDCYVELYFGGGSLFFALPPAKVETINDLDHAVMDFYRVLRDGGFERFRQLAEATPYSRELYDECLQTWEEEQYPVVSAWRWWVAHRQGFGGRVGSWGTLIREPLARYARTAQAFRSAIDGLPAIHERLQSAQIECVDGRRVIERYAVEGAFCYCDPPYVSETRRSPEYRHEMTIADHEALIETLLACPAMVMLSGYDHAVYRPLEEAAWTRRDFETACHAAGRTRASGMQGKGAALRMQPRTETVWMNYEPQGQGRLGLEDLT